MIKMPLQRGRFHPDFSATVLPWASCLPFVQNSRGMLIHRPRNVTSHTQRRNRHISIGYWCGNCVNGNGIDGHNLTFLSAPPEGAILCEACERNAVAAGLPSASDLAGRHVHIGKLKAVLTCGCAQEQGESDGRDPA